MKKVLFVSHTANFAKFNYAFIKWFQSQGWQVDYASDGRETVQYCDNSFTVCFERNPFKPNNIKAFRQLKKIIIKGGYDIIHCHTPMGGVIARLAAKKSRKSGTKVIYTAHGFHFYKGASPLNWLLYYPVEKLLSGMADCLITINGEDYKNAVTRRFSSVEIFKINGVGVDLTKFKKVNPDSKRQLRREYGYSDEDYILITVAEINKNKDQKFIIENMMYLQEYIPKIKVLVVGDGPEKEDCCQLVRRYGLMDKVFFLGYRHDVDSLLQISDLLVSTSHREGLPVNIIEGMASGLPVVCADTRGQRDLIKDGENGRVYKLEDSRTFCDSIIEMYSFPEKASEFGENNIIEAKKYSMDIAVKKMASIYSKYMRTGE